MSARLRRALVDFSLFCTNIPWNPAKELWYSGECCARCLSSTYQHFNILFFIFLIRLPIDPSVCASRLSIHLYSQSIHQTSPSNDYFNFNFNSPAPANRSPQWQMTTSNWIEPNDVAFGLGRRSMIYIYIWVMVNVQTKKATIKYYRRIYIF